MQIDRGSVNLNPMAKAYNISEVRWEAGQK